MEMLEITWWRATKIWWSIFWRCLFYGTVISILLGFVAGFTSAALHVTEQVKPLLELTGFIIGILISIWVIKMVLGMQYSDFRIVLLPSFESMLDKEHPEGI